MGDPSRTLQPAVDENSLSLPKRGKFLRLIEEVTAAGHQEATIVVTSFKIIKFLIKSGFGEEAGLGIAAGKGPRRMRWAGRRENGQRLSPIVKDWLFLGKGGGCQGTVGCRKGCLRKAEAAGLGRGILAASSSSSLWFYPCCLCTVSTPLTSSHVPGWRGPTPEVLSFFSGGVCDMTAFSLGEGHP